MTVLTRFAVAFGGALVLAYSSMAVAQLGGTTVQLPTFGVAVDAEGVLRMKEVGDRDGKLLLARIAAAPRQTRGRCRSAVEAAIHFAEPFGSRDRCEAEGRRSRSTTTCCNSPDCSACNTRCCSTRAAMSSSPAPPEALGRRTALGHVVGITTGRPTIPLVDLATALRHFRPAGKNAPFVGCTIDPTPEGLQRLQEFQQTVPRTIPQNARGQVAIELANGTQKALGMANVRVFGVPADTHFAQVLIEADYRMKLIGIGLEPPPVKMVTFLGPLDRGPAERAAAVVVHAELRMRAGHRRPPGDGAGRPAACNCRARTR